MNQFWFATIEGTLSACKPVICGGSFASGKSAKERAARVRACNFETGRNSLQVLVLHTLRRHKPIVTKHVTVCSIFNTV